MNPTFGSAIAAWLATYAIHSTLLIAGVALFVRLRAPNAAVRDFAWKLALTGALFTATVQQAGNLRPLGSFAFERSSVVEPGTALRPRAPTSATNRPVGVDAFKIEVDAPDEAAPSKEAGATIGTTHETPSADISEAQRTNIASPDAASNVHVPAFALTTWAVAAWGAVALLLALSYIARRLMLAGRLVTRRSVTDGPLHALLDVMRAETHFDGPVTLTAASTIASPVALGLSEICVPEAALTDLDEEQQRGLLAHELAHLSRRDPLWLDLASLLERVFFFQPLNRLARRELQQNAEYICDDWAATHNGSGEPLARCLARVAEWIEASPLGVPVAGMAEQRSLLVSRIARLLEDTPVRFTLSRITMATATVVALVAVVAAVPSVHATAAEQAGDSTRTRADVARTLEREARTRGTSAPARLAELAAIRESRHTRVAQLAAMNARPAIAAVSARAANPSFDRMRGDSDPDQDPAVVTALIERLGDSNAGVRRAAAQSLGNLRAKRAVTALIGALGDKSREVRTAAAGALGNIEDSKAIPSLVKAMGDESAEVRDQAINALSHFESDVPVAPMIAALSDARPDIRARAADILGNMGDKAAITPLAKLLKDPVADVRREALQSLSRFRDASVITAILGALADDHPEVRAAALNALREAHVQVSETTLLKLLADNSSEVRQQAVQFFREQPLAPAVVTALSKLIADDPSGDVKEAAVETLAEARNPAARDALRAALNSSDARVRRAAAEALGNRP